MTGSQMLSLLSQKIEDESDTLLTTTEKTTAINQAQIKVASLVDKSYLYPLESTESSVTIASGSVDLSSSAVDIYEQMLFRKVEFLKIVDSASEEAFLHIIDFEEIHKINNQYYDKTNMDSAYQYSGHGYMWGSTLYVRPSNIATVDIYYYRKPKSFVTGVSGSGSQAIGLECELGSLLHEPVIDMAASDIFFRDNKEARGVKSFENSIAIINVANQRELEVIEKGTGLKT
jgi:hypothetical protein